MIPGPESVLQDPRQLSSSVPLSCWLFSSSWLCLQNWEAGLVVDAVASAHASIGRAATARCGEDGVRMLLQTFEWGGGQG